MNPAKTTPCSILVPVFNSEQLIEQGLSSILSSARDFDQVIVIDDGSTDNSPKLIHRFAELDSRIVFKQRPHYGLVNTLNYGLTCCDFDLIARADIDDLYLQSRITDLTNFMIRNESVAAVFSDYTIRGQNSQFLGNIYSAILPNLTKLSLATSSRTPHPGVMFRKSVIKELGSYREENYPTEDLALWIKVANHSQIASFPRPLLEYTLSPNGISANAQKLMAQNVHILRTILAHNLDFSKVEEEFCQLKNIYAQSNGGSERFLSLIRDLLIVSQSCKPKERKYCIELSVQILSHFQSDWIGTAIKMRRFQKLRSAYRKGLFT